MEEPKRFFCTLKNKSCIVELRSYTPICVQIIACLDAHIEPMIQEHHMIGSIYTLATLDQLSPIVTDLFKVGDIVQSAYNNKFTVVGFETISNKVIVKSNTNHDNRKRFAYNYNELTVCNYYYIQIGNHYKINKFGRFEYECIAAIDPNFTDKILLVCLEGTMAGSIFIIACKQITELNQSKFIVTKEELIAQEINSIYNIT